MKKLILITIIIIFSIFFTLTLCNASILQNENDFSSPWQLKNNERLITGKITSINNKENSIIVSNLNKREKLFWDEKTIFAIKTLTYSQLISPQNLYENQNVSLYVLNNDIRALEINSINENEIIYKGNSILKNNNIINFCVSANNKYLAISTINEEIFLYTLPQLKQIAIIPVNDSNYLFCFSPSGSNLYYINYDLEQKAETLCTYNLKTQTFSKIKSIKSDQELIRSFVSLKCYDEEEVTYTIWEGTPQSEFLYSEVGIYNKNNKPDNIISLPYTIDKIEQLNNSTYLVLDSISSIIGTINIKEKNSKLNNDENLKNANSFIKLNNEKLLYSNTSNMITKIFVYYMEKNKTEFCIELFGNYALVALNNNNVILFCETDSALYKYNILTKKCEKITNISRNYYISNNYIYYYDDTIDEIKILNF